MKNKLQGWIVLNAKGEPSGCVPYVFDEKYRLAMLTKNSGLYSTFELKKFAQLYKKTLVPKGRVVKCQIIF